MQLPISIKSGHSGLYRFPVKWQTNILDSRATFSFLTIFLGLFLGEFTKLFVKNTKGMEMLQTISFEFDTFKVIKNLFDHLFEHNLNLYISI
jgi:hypothetical protein